MARRSRRFHLHHIAEGISPQAWRRWTGPGAMLQYTQRAAAATAIAGAWRAYRPRNTMTDTNPGVGNRVQADILAEPMSRKRTRSGNLRAGGWQEVGGDAQGPGQCRTGAGAQISNTPQDASLVKITTHGAKWLMNWKDKRSKIDQMIWPQNLVNYIKDVPAMTFNGESDSPGDGLTQKIFSFQEWDMGDIQAMPSVGAALSTSVGTGAFADRPGGIMGMISTGSMTQSLVYKAVGVDDAAEGRIMLPHCVSRYRMRNTSMRPARVRIYEFDCARACKFADRVESLWTEWNPQKIANTTAVGAVVTAMNTATGDTWQSAVHQESSPSKPFARPQGYKPFWKLVNTSHIDLKPGKQVLYTTSMKTKSVNSRRLQQEIVAHGATGYYPGASKIVMIILMGDSVTINTGTGVFGYGDTKLALERERQFVSSVLWAYRPKTVQLSIQTERGEDNYYHEIATAAQGGTLTGVAKSFVDGGNAYDANNN